MIKFIDFDTQLGEITLETILHNSKILLIISHLKTTQKTHGLNPVILNHGKNKGLKNSQLLHEPNSVPTHHNTLSEMKVFQKTTIIDRADNSGLLKSLIGVK